MGPLSRKFSSIAVITCMLLALIAVAIVAAPAAGYDFTPAYVAALGMLWMIGVGMTFSLQDEEAAVKKTLALPTGASTVATAGIDLGHGLKGDFLARSELLITAPLLVVGELANTETMTYDVYHDTASDFSGEALLLKEVITQTGAGGAGAAAASVQVALPAGVSRYIRVKATNSAAADASAKSLTAQLVF